MDIRVLRYFLKISELGNISKAAESLHTTQPNLSRQLTQLEEELGRTLVIRGKRRLTLTEEGEYLRKQALSIVEMADHTESTLKSFQNHINGHVHIGAAESTVMAFFASIFQKSWETYPGISYHLNSGNYVDVTRSLDNGLADFGIVIEKTDKSKYHHLQLPHRDTWGILMHRDSPLAQQKTITPADFAQLSLIASREIEEIGKIKNWASEGSPKVIATCNLITNAALMIEATSGYALTFEGLTFPSESNHLVFCPLEPAVTSSTYLIWKKDTPLSKSAQIFLELVKEAVGEQKD